MQTYKDSEALSVHASFTKSIKLKQTGAEKRQHKIALSSKLTALELCGCTCAISKQSMCSTAPMREAVFKAANQAILRRN